MISKKVKCFLKENNLKAIDYSDRLGLARSQSLNNKYIRESFTVQDIIILANMLDCDVSITDKDGQIIKKFTKFDLEDNDK